MKVQIKYFIVITGFIAAVVSLVAGNTGAGVAAAGAFIAFALIEIQDLKILNKKEQEE
jgi:hypothetical protein